MRARSVFTAVLATPLILVDLGLLALAGFLLFWALWVAIPVFPSLWLLTLGVATSSAVYLGGLVLIAAVALQDGVRELRTPNRVLRCSLLGLGMNSAGALLGFVILLVTLSLRGGLY
jgi:hypothetical protein